MYFFVSFLLILSLSLSLRQDGETALFAAAIEGHDAVMLALIEVGSAADVQNHVCARV